MSHGMVNPPQMSDKPRLGNVIFDTVKKYARKDFPTSEYDKLPSIPYTKFEKFDVEKTDLANREPLSWYIRVGHSTDWNHIIYACVSGKDTNKVTFLRDNATLKSTEVGKIEFEDIFAYMNNGKPNTKNGQNMVKTLILFCFVDFLRTKKMNGKISITDKFWKWFPDVCKWFKDGDCKRKREEATLERQREMEEDMADEKKFLPSPSDSEDSFDFSIDTFNVQTAPKFPKVHTAHSDSGPSASTGTSQNIFASSEPRLTAAKRKHSTDSTDKHINPKRPCDTCKQAESQTVIDLAKQIADLSKGIEDETEAKKQELQEKDRLHAQELAKMKQEYQDKLAQTKKDADARIALKDWRIKELCMENTSVGSDLAEEKQNRNCAEKVKAEQKRLLQTLEQQHASLKQQVKFHENRTKKLIETLGEPIRPI